MSNIRKIIILIGQPGSGKGTQASILAENVNLPHISTGNIFRSMLKKNNDISKKLKLCMEEGKLVPTEIVNEVVINYLGSDKIKKGCILDGYPRNVEQAKYLIAHVEADYHVIFLETSNDVAKKRILGRYSCANCMEIYNEYFANPKEEGICDKCNSTEFSHRSDDNEEAVVTRLNEYQRETHPVTKFFSDKSSFYNVDANKKIGDVVNEIIKIANKI